MFLLSNFLCPYLYSIYYNYILSAYIEIPDPERSAIEVCRWATTHEYEHGGCGLPLCRCLVLFDVSVDRETSPHTSVQTGYPYCQRLAIDS